MRAVGGNYLRRREILIVSAVFVSASVLFSVTALTLLGFYEDFGSYVGGGEGVTLIYSGTSDTPFTGLVPRRLAENASRIGGVGTVSPETTVPSLIGGSPVLVRGVVPDRFGEISNYALSRGDPLEYDDANSAMVGEEASERLGIGIGDDILVTSAVSEEFAVLSVAGVFRSGSWLGDEILVPLYRAQWLRGTSRRYTTFLRIEHEENLVSAGELKEKILPVENRREGREGAWEGTPRKIAPGLRSLEIGGGGKFMGRYLREYGVTRTVLLSLSVTVFLFAGLGALIACKNLVRGHEEEIVVLRSLGMSERGLKLDLLSKLLPYFIASSTLGFGIGLVSTRLLSRTGYLRVLAHTVEPSFGWPGFALLTAVTACLGVLSVWRSSEEIELEGG